MFSTLLIYLQSILVFFFLVEILVLIYYTLCIFSSERVLVKITSKFQLKCKSLQGKINLRIILRVIFRDLIMFPGLRCHYMMYKEEYDRDKFCHG